MNISDIKAQIKTGFARPNLFRVTINNIAASRQPEFRINCYQTQIPGSNLATTDKDTGFRSAAYHKLYADIILGFYCSIDMKELQFFQDWIDLIVHPRTNRKSYYTNYTTTIVIEQLSRLSTKLKPHDLEYHGIGKVTPLNSLQKREKELYESNKYDAENIVSARWTLKEAYPKQVDPIQLDYSTNDTVMSMNVTLTYRTFEHEFGLAKYGSSAPPMTQAQRYSKEILKQETWTNFDEHGNAIWTGQSNASRGFTP